MKLGFVSAIVPELSLVEVFSVAQDYGYECVEVMCWPVGAADRRYAGVTHIDVANLDESNGGCRVNKVHPTGNIPGCTTVVGGKFANKFWNTVGSTWFLR